MLQKRQLGEKIFISVKAPMHINSHTKFQLEFSKFLLFNSQNGQEGGTHHYAKFCRNRSNRIWDVVIFRFFNMAVAAILNFQNLKFLTIEKVKKVEVHQRAEFRRNHSNSGRGLQNAYSRPFLGFFWDTFPPNDVTYRPNPKMDHPWAEPRHLSHKPRIFSYWWLNGPYKSPLHVFPIALTLRGPRNSFFGGYKYGGGKYLQSK